MQQGLDRRSKRQGSTVEGVESTVGDSAQGAKGEEETKEVEEEGEKDGLGVEAIMVGKGGVEG